VETIGEAVRRLRQERGLTLRGLARDAHVDAGHLSRIENDKRGQPTAEVIASLERALDAGGELAALLPKRWEFGSGLWLPADSEQLAADLATEQPTAANAVRLAHDWLIAEPPQLAEKRAGRRIGVSLVEQVERRVHQLRLMDDHVGGADTYAMVTAELAATTALLADCAYTEEIGKRLLVAVGELAQLAGWTSSDAGRYAEAERLYLLGVRAAHAGGDPAGAANNLSSLAYQASNVGDAHQALTLARSAYAGARHDATAKSRALLGERIAWAAARAGDAQAAERALGAVETDYARQGSGDEDPEWVYWLSPEEVEVMAGRVWTELQRPLRAVPILERAIAGYGDDTGRETSLYQTWMAESLAQANEPERAAAAATKALRLSRQAGSVRAEDRVAAVRKQLRRYRGNSAVDAFEEEARTGA
jgi:transcriptional regulator with XRE-family HTH domain